MADGWIIEIHSDGCPYKRIGDILTEYKNICLMIKGIGQIYCNIETCPIIVGEKY